MIKKAFFNELFSTFADLNKKKGSKMTYEEMLNAKGGYQLQAAKMPYGVLTRKQFEGKFRDVLVVDERLAAITAFREGLKAEVECCGRLQAKQQLRYEVKETADGLCLELEHGSYQTLEQALDSNPALVASPGFVDGIVGGLADIMKQMHAQSVFHLCFSPRNVLIRKGDDMPMLLLHASSFTGMRNLPALFDGMEDFLAPEVKEGGELTAQSDIYSLGQLIIWLYSQGSLPFEYKKVSAKATQVKPEARYASVDQLMEQMKGLRNKKKSFQTLVAAMLIVLVCVGLYFELTPQTMDIEFIEGAPKGPEKSYLDEEAFDPELDMILSGDSDITDTLTAEEQHTLDEYMKKAEEIYRRQFAEKADGILSKVYNNESMNASEKTFMANSSAMSEELIKLQTELAEQTGISDASADRIASEVISKIISEKERNLSPVEGSSDE